MKYYLFTELFLMVDVTTFAVVWIEMQISSTALMSAGVTTFAVVWIEISIMSQQIAYTMSHHLRGGVD